MKTHAPLFLLLGFLFIFFSGYAQPKQIQIDRGDSVSSVILVKPQHGSPDRLNRFTSSHLFQITHVGIPLAVGALIVKEKDKQFRAIRNDYVPRYDYAYDDFLQYGPAVAMLGLKVAGVEGRSSWSRMLVSDAFSAALMVGSVNSIKYLVKEQRPDGSADNSFPSGHTATAFMAATMLHKEYGLTRSPWYSVLGYTMALGTGVSRQLNNRHWASDVMFGAALGILSTEVGYWLADMIFKENGLLRRERERDPFEVNHKPSFIGIYLGASFMLNAREQLASKDIHLSTGAIAGVEGAWFAHKYFGLGGRISVTSMQLSVAGKVLDESLDMKSVQVGPYFSYPLSEYWLAGANLLLGWSNTPSYNSDFFKSERKNGLIGGANANLMYLPHSHFGIKANVGYVMPPSVCASGRYLTRQALLLSGSLNLIF